MDLANKLKGKLNDLMMKSPMLTKALDMANSFSMNLMTDIMSDAIFSAALDKKIKKMEKEGASKEELRTLRRERSKLANKLDTPDDISHKYNLSNAGRYERKKIDDTKYFEHDKGDFGERLLSK